MKKEFVTYEQALALKELGFDEPCFGWYLPEIVDKGNIASIILAGYLSKWNKFGDRLSAPLYQQAFRWFREKYNLRGFIGFRPNVKQFDFHIYDMSLSGLEYVKQRTMEEFNKDPKVGTYEEAELACLKKLIEIVKKKDLKVGLLVTALTGANGEIVKIEDNKVSVQFADDRPEEAPMEYSMSYFLKVFTI